MKKGLIILALLLSACDETTIINNIPAPECKEVLLEWDTPTERVDGTELLMHEIFGYEIAVREQEATEPYITTEVPIGDESVVEMFTYAMTELKTGMQCFKIRTIDSDMQAGPWSETICLDLLQCLYNN